MEQIKEVLPLCITLLVCLINGYSMCSYRVPVKKAALLFLAVTVVCLVGNSCIVLYFGRDALLDLMLVTVALPYFILILLISKDKISQTFFNFWLWITIYSFISNLALFINEITLRDLFFEVVIRNALFIVYFIAYQKFLKIPHRMVIENLKVSWWLISVVPILFTVLIRAINIFFPGRNGFSRNYLILLIVFVLMIAVYLLIVFVFRTEYASSKKDLLSQNMKSQMVLQKNQYEHYMQQMESERIFRHDQRHRNSILMNILETGDIDAAKEFLSKERFDIEKGRQVVFCDNMLVNAVLSDYKANALKKGVEFNAEIQLPKVLACDEAEFCVIVSNLLENCLDDAVSYITIETKSLNGQIFIKFENDYTGERLKDKKGKYITTKENGTGFGLKSVEHMIKPYDGQLVIDEGIGVFKVFVSMKNCEPI